MLPSNCATDHETGYNLNKNNFNSMEVKNMLNAEKYYSY